MLISASEDSLNKAHDMFRNETTKEGSQKALLRDQRKCSLLIADAYYVHSLLAAAEGRSMEALYLGRLSAKKLQKLWATLEKDRGRTREINRTGDMENANDADSMPELSITEHQLTEIGKPATLALIGAAFWSLASRLFQGLIHLSQLFAYHGLLQEVRYYLKQAKAVAETVKAGSFIGRHNSLLGQCSICGGKPHEGLQNLQDAESALANFPHDRHYTQMQLSLAKYNIENGRGESGLSALTIAEETLRNLMTRDFLEKLLPHRPKSEDLNSQFAALTVQDKKPVRQPQKNMRKANSKKQTTTMSSVKTEDAKLVPEELPAAETVALSRMKNEILRVRIHAAISAESLHSAVTLLDEAVSSSEVEQSVVLRTLLASQVRLRQAIQQLVSDPVFCVLPESTIAYPSIKTGNERQQQKSSPNKPANIGTAVSTRNQQARGFASKIRRKSPLRCKFDVSLLDQAQTSLLEAYKLARTHSMTSTIHEVTKVLGKILTMLSATWSCAPNRPVSSTFMAYILGASSLICSMTPS